MRRPIPTALMDFDTFRYQLRYWAIHCTLNALPSFCIAFFSMGLWRRPQAAAAMLLAIGTFIILYALLTSLSEPFTNEDHVLFRALRVGTKARAWISGFSLLILPLGGLLVMPDFWCGWLAVWIIGTCFREFGMRAELAHDPKLAGFGEVFATTMLEGLILSFILLLISFFAVIYLQARERRRIYETVDPRRVNGL